MRNITVLRGDGIGPEITDAVLKVLNEFKLNLIFEQYEVGEECLKKYGDLIPQKVFDSIEKNRIVLKAPITTPIGKGFRSLNVELRKKYDLYVNIRPAISLPNVITKFDNINITTFRENTEGLYIGREIKIDDDTFEATKLSTRKGCTRIIRKAFEYAQENNKKKITCLHKANILKLTDGLFLDIFNEIKLEYPNIISNDMIIDNACMQLVMKPEQFEVLVTENLYGDIVSDLTSGLIGGLGLLPSSNFGDDLALFEAVHGSAPDIANQNIANPTALLLAACLMLDYLNLREEATQIREAINETLKNGIKTKDLNGTATTTVFTNEIIKNIKKEN